MLIEYAINYYCWARLQAFILLRMYGCGRSIDVVPASTSHLSLHTSSESQWAVCAYVSDAHCEV